MLSCFPLKYLLTYHPERASPKYQFYSRIQSSLAAWAALSGSASIFMIFLPADGSLASKAAAVFFSMLFSASWIMLAAIACMYQMPDVHRPVDVERDGYAAALTQELTKLESALVWECD